MTRDVDSIERVGVVGAGMMGSGIAQVAATSGYDVVMRDIEREFAESGFDSIADTRSAGRKRDAHPGRG